MPTKALNKGLQAAKAAPLNETAHLLSSPANAERLYAALDRDRRSQRETHELPAIPVHLLTPSMAVT